MRGALAFPDYVSVARRLDQGGHGMVECRLPLLPKTRKSIPRHLPNVSLSCRPYRPLDSSRGSNKQVVNTLCALPCPLIKCSTKQVPDRVGTQEKPLEACQDECRANAATLRRYPWQNKAVTRSSARQSFSRSLPRPVVRFLTRLFLVGDVSGQIGPRSRLLRVMVACQP